MSNEYNLLSKALSDAQLATIHCKEIASKRDLNISKWDLDNLLEEAKQLENLAKSLKAELLSITSI